MLFMKKILPFLLAALSGIIPILSLISPLPGILVLVGYIPLLYAEVLLTKEKIKRPSLMIFLAAFLCFFITNIVSFWPFEKLLSYWIIIYSLFSAFLYAGTFLLFSIVKRRLGNAIGYFSWIVFIVALEFLTLNIDFSFPCLLNGVLIFGSGNTSLIQWYEYTGVLGGSAWILLCNLLLFKLIKGAVEFRKLNVKLSIVVASCVLLPIVFSLARYYTYKEIEDPMEVVVVQPNFDPYTEKFVIGYDKQLDTMLALAERTATLQTQYIIFPETALDSNIWLNNITENYMVLKIKDSLLTNYPQAKVITGADVMEYYVVHDGIPPTSTAKKADEKVYYDFFNAAFQVDANGNVQSYKKSKLVIGTEYVPLVQQFPQLEKWVIHLGGSAQSRGKQTAPSLLNSSSANIATVICFESIFGDYVSRFVRLGADAICVISNDGWWNEKPIPMRHFRYSQLRAIENRRPLIRSANTGISGFIDQRGDIIEQSQWWERTALRNTVNKNTKLTFYSRYGDYIGRICAGLFVLILAWLGIDTMRNRRRKV